MIVYRRFHGERQEFVAAKELFASKYEPFHDSSTVFDSKTYLPNKGDEIHLEFDSPASRLLSHDETMEFQRLKLKAFNLTVSEVKHFPTRGHVMVTLIPPAGEVTVWGSDG